MGSKPADPDMKETGRISGFLFLYALSLKATEEIAMMQKPFFVFHDFLNCCLHMDKDRRASARDLLEAECKVAATKTTDECNRFLTHSTPKHQMVPTPIHLQSQNFSNEN